MSALAGLQQQAAFTRWLCRALLGSLYPGAPFERKFLAMLLLNTLLLVWDAPDKTVRCSSPGYGHREGCLAALLRLAGAQDVRLLCPGFLGPKTVQASKWPLSCLSADACVQLHAPRLHALIDLSCLCMHMSSRIHLVCML